MPRPIKAALDEARRAPLPEGARAALMMRHGSMTLRHYAPRGVDEQTPHDQDEVYIVMAGRGDFVVGGERVGFGPGDVLFAAAGDEHRFENFTDDFETWVVFYGPAGGESG